jgi:predicted O-methyltransferase YrrM
MTLIENRINDVDSIEGILSKKEQKLLHELAQRSRGNIVEIGSWKGLSTVCLALGLEKGYKVYAIDPHKGSALHKMKGNKNSYKEFMNNIIKLNVQDLVIPMVMTSKKAFESWDKGEIDLLWIDGNHEYEYVKYDVENWTKLLNENGILAMHDFASPIDIDVTKVVFNTVVNKMEFVKVIDKIILFRNTGIGTHGINEIKLRFITLYRKLLYKNYNSFPIKIVRNIKRII